MAKLPTVIMVAFSIFFIAPLFFVMYGSFVPSFTSAKYTLSFVVQAFTSPRTAVVLANSLEMATGSSLMAVSVATIYAWFVSRTDIPGKLFLKSAAPGRIVIPILGEAFSWILIFSPGIGLANLMLKVIFGINYPVFDVYTMWGLIFALGTGSIPFAFLTLEPLFESLNSSLEESSRLAGAGHIRTFVKVTFPLVLPGLVSVFMLSFLGGILILEYPLLIGSTARIVTLSTEVYNLASLGQYSLASAYGIFYILVALILLIGYLWVTQKSYRYMVVARASAQTLIRLGRWRWPAFVLLTCILFFSLFVSIIVLFLVSLVQNYSVVGTTNPFVNLSLQNYVNVLQQPLFDEAFANSILLSVGAGVIATVLGAIMSFVLVKGNSRGRNVLYFISNLPLAFPGVVYSVALIWTFLLIPIFNQYIYGTIWVMLVGTVVIYSPFTIRLISPGLIQISDELEETAAVLGSSWSRRFVKVTLPLLRSSMINSFTYVMLSVFRELSAVVLLYNASSILLIILVLSLYDNNASLPEVSAMLIMMMAFSGVIVVLSRLVLRQKSSTNAV
jgi:iron(III) transport system permease protein